MRVDNRTGIIDARTKDVLEQLRDLSDEALSDDVEPTMAEADTFYEAAQGLPASRQPHRERRR